MDRFEPHYFFENYLKYFPKFLILSKFNRDILVGGDILGKKY